MELALFCILAIVAAAALIGAAPRIGVWGVCGGALLLASAAGAAWLWDVKSAPARESAAELRAAAPRLSRDGGFVSSQTCKGCHPKNHASWHATHHRTMTQVAGPGTVLAPFDGRELSHQGSTWRLERRGEEFFAASRPSSSPVEAETARRIVLTTGAHHMQEYWMAGTEGSELERVPFAWLLDDNSWAPLEDIFLQPQGSDLGTMSWNASCINCHAVGGETRKDSHGVVESQVADLGISCEACHGPGELHVRTHQNPVGRYLERRSDRPDPTIVHPERLDKLRSAQVCGQCHSVSMKHSDRAIHAERYRAGDDLEQTQLTVLPSLLSPEQLEEWRLTDPASLEGQFWPDGMVRVSGRDLNGLLESACFQRGELTCLSCHSMHDAPANDQLKLDLDGNRACTQCHESYRENVSAHTHHAAESQGSNCYNCHMPHTTYGLLKAIRSHQIDSPRVRTTLETGRPNGCNLCHLDRTLEWTADHLAEWYGHEPAGDLPLSDDQRSVAGGPWWLLSGDAPQRALVAWSAGWGPAQEASGQEWLAPYLAQLLTDPYSAVRYISARSLRSLPAYEGFEYDFVGEEAARAAAQERAWQLWRPAATGASREAVLLDELGELRREDFQRLLQQRDDREVRLEE